MKWKLFSVLPGLMLAHAVLATDPLYQNNAVLNYSVGGSDPPPPQIDATIFDNENVFNVNFYQYSPNPAFYETWNTVNYTNNGTMTANAPILSSTSSGFVILSGLTFGAGFRFDKQTTNQMPRTMAGTFYNPGTIRCNSFLDGNSIFTFGGFQFFSLGTIGECIVSATNIVNPGTIDVGVNSLIDLTGQNVDLTRGTLTVENLQSLLFGNSVGVFSTAFGFGVDTNQDWDPNFDLRATTATGSLPFPLSLTNSTPYFDFRFPETNLNVIRAVFVQNTSPNAAYNVYIEPNLNGSSIVFGPGAAHVEWVGTVDDPATCDVATNYLYLTDDYVLGANPTNLFMNNGTPDNFTFVTSTTPLLFGPVAPAFFNVFPSGTITNPYSYFDGQLIATTAPTNATPANPSGALTNLPGRIQITANKTLNLSLAAISGLNYLSLTATNQFDGSAGAQIFSPYSDINLGVTNGFLVITNLLESALPNWSGFVAAWSTRWLTMSTNSSITINTNGVATTNVWAVTNDWRVLLVRSSQLRPVTAPQVQNLRLHATNSLVITDVLNVLRSLFIDAQNLTLTTNGCGNWATSTDGELNLLSTAILWQSALPNVRNLTNNGAIRTKNLAVFGGPRPANYTNFINHGLIFDQGSTIYADNFLSSGIISNGVGSFLLQSLTTTLTNGSIIAGADVSITTGSLVTSNLMLRAGRSLTLQVTNLLTDGFFLTSGFNPNTTNLNFWSVGSTNGNGGNGFALMIRPLIGDLLGTTITDYVPGPNKLVVNTWAGQDRGVSTSGFSNNAAVGRLFLDALGVNSTFKFNGTGASNGLYVDRLELLDYASYTNKDAGGNIPTLTFNTNLVIYYASAFANGVSVADKLNHKNNEHLRWVPEYVGYFSSTNFIYPDGTTNTLNISLLQSTTIDSDGDGIANAFDPTPLFTTNQWAVNIIPPMPANTNTALFTWHSIPSATNVLTSTTNLLPPFSWQVLTNFISPTNVPPVGGWPITNIVSYYFTNTPTGGSLGVWVYPNSTTMFGP